MSGEIWFYIVIALGIVVVAMAAVMYFAFIRPLLEMKKTLEDAAREKQEIDAENRLLIRNISHDLKTPITAIKGYAEGLLDGVASTPEKQEKYLRTIYTKANDMDALIDELTLYSKIDTNRNPYEFTHMEVQKFFEEYVSDVKDDLDNQNIELTFYSHLSGEQKVVGDKEQLRRVLNNIISNSVKYMDKKKGLIGIRLRDDGEFVLAEVEDNGKGIPKKDLPYIFDRFYRTDFSRNRDTGGSGIGLSIVKKIIEDHGGKIYATSDEGAGTVMHFTLKKCKEAKDE